MYSRKFLSLFGLAAIALSPVIDMAPSATAATRDKAFFESIAGSWKGPGEIVAGKFGSKLYPETWFIDAKGVIRARIDGPRDWLELAPLAIDFAKTLLSPLACEVEFDHRTPVGNQCAGIPQAG